MREVLKLIAALILAIIIGYAAAETKIEYYTAENFFDSKVSFCDLSVGEKIRACPKARLVEYDNESGAEVTTYYCDEESAFIVVEDASLKFMAKMRIKFLKLSVRGVEVVPVCTTDNDGEVFYLNNDGMDIA